MPGDDLPASEQNIRLLQWGRDFASALLIGGATVFTTTLIADNGVTIQAFIVFWSLLTLLVAVVSAINAWRRRARMLPALVYLALVAYIGVELALPPMKWPAHSRTASWWLLLAYAFLAILFGQWFRRRFDWAMEQMRRELSSK